jgi:hypothetical protein
MLRERERERERGEIYIKKKIKERECLVGYIVIIKKKS